MGINMSYEVKQYELCEHVIEKSKEVEKVIGMIRYFGDCFEAFVKDHGQISKGGFELFDNKQTAIECIIEKYENPILL